MENPKKYEFKKNNYTQKCSILSKKYDLPFELCLTLGTREKNYEELFFRLRKLNNSKNPYFETLLFKDEKEEQRKALILILQKLYWKLKLDKRKKGFYRVREYLRTYPWK